MTKRCAPSTAAHHFGLILRKLPGWDKLRELAAMAAKLLRALPGAVPFITRGHSLQLASPNRIVGGDS